MSDMRPMVRRIACICLLLTLWSAAAFAAHMHADAADEAHCTLCVAAHTASPASPAVLLFIAALFLSILLLEPVTASRQRLAVFALSVRPPPSRSLPT